MGAIYLVRHGQASFGKENYDHLSDVGFEQSRVLGEHLNSQLRADVLISGSMQRHLQTADKFINSMSSPPALLVDGGFNEFNHEEVVLRLNPQWKTKKDLTAFLSTQENSRKVFHKIFMDALQRWISGEHDEDYEESWSAFRSRVIKALNELKNNVGASKNIVVFTSGGAISVVCQWLLNLGTKETFAINEILANAGITRLLYSKDRISLSYLNNYSHLENIDSNLVTFR